MKANAEVQEYWKNQIAEFLKSGLDRKTYCEQNNLKMHSLDYWRSKLKRRSPTGDKKAPGKWVTLQVADQEAGNAGIRIRVGRLVIELDSNFNRDALADVLKIAGSAC